MSQVNTTLPRLRAARGVAVVVGLLLLIVWLGFFLFKGLPWLYGPYIVPFLDAGPVVVGRGGAMGLALAPVVALTTPLLLTRHFWTWLLLQVAALGVCFGMAWSFGSYAHEVVHSQGVSQSLTYLAAEVGFPDADHVPEHIKQAFVISDKLAAEGKAPGAPFQWRRVDWPKY